MKREEAIDVVKSGFEKLEETLKQGKSDALLKSDTSAMHHFCLASVFLPAFQIQT